MYKPAPHADLRNPRHMPIGFSCIYESRMATVVGHTFGPNPHYDLLDADGHTKYRDVSHEEVV